MRVNFYATLRPLAGGKTISVALPTALPTLAVLRTASENHPALAAEMWDANGILREHIKVFINGRHSAHLPNGLDTLIGEQDELDVFPPVGGGAC
ncbi:MAG: MoaD/ThiS family protein [Chloroflexi bacterium]|nr:MoaD/ThiS family protein [Chloroflexota bacterium]